MRIRKCPGICCLCHMPRSRIGEFGKADKRNGKEQERVMGFSQNKKDDEKASEDPYHPGCFEETGNQKNYVIFCEVFIKSGLTKTIRDGRMWVKDLFHFGPE